MISVQEIKPETLQKLVSLAEAHGFRSIDDYVAALLSDGKSATTSAEQAQRWEAWVAAQQIAVPHKVEISRDSIYTREDEAL